MRPAWRAQSACSHGQLPADISDAIPEQKVQRPSQMLKLFVLVIKLNFIVTLSGCYCTGSASHRPDFIIPTVYESPGLCHCTSLSYNSSVPSQSGRPGRGEKREGDEGREKERKNGYDKSKGFSICRPDLQFNKHCHRGVHTRVRCQPFLLGERLCVHSASFYICWRTDNTRHAGRLRSECKVLLTECFTL